MSQQERNSLVVYFPFFVAVALFRGFCPYQIVEFIRIKLNELIDRVVCRIEESKWFLDYHKIFFSLPIASTQQTG